MFPPEEFTGQGPSSPGARQVPPAPAGNNPVNWPTSSSSTPYGQSPGTPGRSPISLQKKQFKPGAELCRTEVAGIADLPPLLVLATAPNSQVIPGSGSTPNHTVAMGLTTRKTRTVWNEPVFPPKPGHSKFTILAPFEYLNSDRITTWSIRRLWNFGQSFTYHFQICDPTSVRWVVIENQRISLRICHQFTSTQWISVILPIWLHKVKERQKLNNLHIDHIMIRSKLKYLIGAKAVGTWLLEL